MEAFARARLFIYALLVRTVGIRLRANAETILIEDLVLAATNFCRFLSWASALTLVLIKNKIVLTNVLDEAAFAGTVIIQVLAKAADGWSILVVARALTSLGVEFLVILTICCGYGALAVAVVIKLVPKAADLFGKFSGTVADTATGIKNLLVDARIKVELAFTRALFVELVI